MVARKTPKPDPAEQSAAELLLEMEEKRKARRAKRAERAKRKREQEQLAAVQRMQQSIETMKHCIIGITTIMLAGIVIAIWVLVILNSKVHELQAELDKIQPTVDKIPPTVEKIVEQVNGAIEEVEKVREALRNPMESIGGVIGRNLDAKLQGLVDERLGGGN